MLSKITHLSSRGLLLWGAVLALGFTSCNKKEADAAKATVTYTGQVKLYDEFGALLTNHAGAKVSLYDDASVVTETAADGTFSLANAPSGKHRLVVSKDGFMNYYTDELTTSSPGYTLRKPIAFGQEPGRSSMYTVRVKSDNVRKYMVLSGVLDKYDPAETRPRFHRVFLDISLTHQVPDVSSFKYTKMFRNNKADGFSDTIPYSKLIEKNVGANPIVGMFSCNPAADSCLSPISHTNPANPFVPSYPGTNLFSSQDVIFTSWQK